MSTAQASSSTGAATPPPHPPTYDELRQQAGPLPSKRGEIGFVEGVHIQTPTRQEFPVNLPARHPADRGNEETEAVPLTPAPNGTSGNAPTQPPNDGTTPPPPQTNSEPVDQGLADLLFSKLKKRKPVKVVQGIRLTTLLFFILQFLILAACIVAWIFTAKKLSSMAKGGNTFASGVGSTVFLHVIFAFAVIGQVVFLERRVYRMRAERYTHLHPGEMLPRYRDRAAPGGDISFAFAPWNRPPLPTYAAVLAQSGLGTGDADDHLIAVPPPPAYGNTRGSTLLLSGFLRDSLRAQRPPSVHSDVERGVDGSSGNGEVDREGHLQQTLARLERSRSNR